MSIKNAKDMIVSIKLQYPEVYRDFIICIEGHPVYLTTYRLYHIDMPSRMIKLSDIEDILIRYNRYPVVYNKHNQACDLSCKSKLLNTITFSINGHTILNRYSIIGPESINTKINSGIVNLYIPKYIIDIDQSINSPVIYLG
jgi:hypothetical protein